MNKSIPDKLYHGSPNKFNQFDMRFIGSNVGTSGASIGFYFSTSIEEAITYGQYIYVVDFKKLNLLKNVSNFVRSLSDSQVINLLDSILVLSKGTNNYYENYDEYFFKDYVSNSKLKLKKDITSKILTGFRTNSDTTIISSLVNAGIQEKYIFEALHKLGYNYTLDQHDCNEFKNAQHYILYFAPKIMTKLTFKNLESYEEYKNNLLL